MRFPVKPLRLILPGVLLALIVALAGCADAPPTPPAPTHTVTLVPTPTRTATSVPTPTHTPTATPSPSPTPSPTPTSTPTSTPTPTSWPSPTPQPHAQGRTGRSTRLAAALHHQTNGDYDQAIAAYLALLEDDAAPGSLDETRLARYHLAESYLLNRQYLAAAAAWEEYLAEYPDDDLLPAATLMLARALHAANECASALPYYQAYLTHETVLADRVYEWIGDCHAELAADLTDPGVAWEEAIAAYRLALDTASAATDRGVQVSLREKIAGLYLALEMYDAAVAEYDAILDVARIDSYRAKIEYLAGQALAAAGQVEAAQARYRRAVDKYPKAGFAYLSLVELVDAGAPVDEFQRGLVDYYAGRGYPDAYGAAIRAFDRYLAVGAGDPPPDRAADALYYKALAQRALDQLDAALATLETLINDYPESERLPRAWLEKGATLAWKGDNDVAVKTYQDMAAFFPANDLAPEALWRAAKLREGEGAHTQAARLFEEVQANFPAFEDADEALWRAGLAHYRAGDEEKASADWQALLAKYPRSPYRTKSLYWLGKVEEAGCRRQGAGGAGQGAEGSCVLPASWNQLVTAEPRSYYALRVQQVRSGESLTATRLITAAVEPPSWDAAQVEAELLDWLVGWTSAPTDTHLSALPTTITRRRDFRRGEALLSAGLRDEALDEFDDVRAAAADDPLALTQLALYFHARGLHGQAARAAMRVARLWPQGSLYGAPLPLQHLGYPLAYADLLSAEAQARNLDPLLLAALVRQESLFEPAAESYAGARGLGQVMPATGQGIARNLGMEDFVLDDLYRPYISIRFGAYYLAVQMRRFDDQVLIALAAYNGGPGNTLRWLEASGPGQDLDLFVEVITAAQSRLYLQKVYQQYLLYEDLYRSP